MIYAPLCPNFIKKSALSVRRNLGGLFFCAVEGAYAGNVDDENRRGGLPSAAFPGGRVGERLCQKLAPWARSALVDLRRRGQLNAWYAVRSLTSY